MEVLSAEKRRRSSGAQNLFHPADDAALQAHLDAVWVVGRFCEQIPDDPFREGAASLIFFPDHFHPHAGCDVGSVVAIHWFALYHRSLSKRRFLPLIGRSPHHEMVKGIYAADQFASAFQSLQYLEPFITTQVSGSPFSIQEELLNAV